MNVELRSTPTFFIRRAGAVNLPVAERCDLSRGVLVWFELRVPLALGYSEAETLEQCDVDAFIRSWLPGM